MKRRQHQIRLGHRLIASRKVEIFTGILLEWYENWGREFPWRHSHAILFHQVVSEILLQRTKAETIAAYWPTFLSSFPSWRSLASVTVKEIKAVLKPIGLSTQRAPRLKGLAIAISKNNGRFPVTRKEIEALPGIGQYIANAIEMFVHGKPRPLIDVNMARVLERYFGPRKLADIRHDPYLQQLGHAVVDHPRAPEVNWAILDFAALVCTVKRPRCFNCQLAAACQYPKKTKERICNQKKRRKRGLL